MQRTGPWDILLRTLARNVMLPLYRRRLAGLGRALARAKDQQREWLAQRLQKCRDTRYGRDHHFSQIANVDDFRRNVPVSRYDDIAPYINAVARGDFGALFPADEPVARFTITTGSTGVPKLNPVTAPWFREYRNTWDLWGLKMLLDHPGHIGGKIIQMPGTWDMGQTEGGIPISMVSTLMARHQHPFVKKFQGVPQCVSDIADPAARFYTTLRLTIPQSISLICQMNPGALVRLAEIGDEYRESLIRDIHDGTLSDQLPIPAGVRQALARQIRRADPQQARRLEQVVRNTGHLYPKDYWNAPIVTCWLGGTAGYQSRYLRNYFGESPLRDMGLVSSEGRHTIPLENDKPEGVLAVTANFYEFVPVSEIDAANPTALEGHELQEGADYYLLMTTSGGYCRFSIGDIVRCRGFVGEAPVLEFLQKGDRCADLEGEKVTEIQFVQAADQAASELGIRPQYITVVPCRPQRSAPCYMAAVEFDDIPDTRLAERFAESIDQGLIASNFLYRAKRRERVLGPLQLVRLSRGSWSKYVHHEIARRGTGDSQYKHPALVLDPNWLEQFTSVDVVIAAAHAA